MKSYPTKFKSLLLKIVQMGTLQKLQNSIQTLLIFWSVYPIHTNSLFWVIFVELPFCHFSPPNTSIRGKDSKIQLIFHLHILVFQTNGKQPYSFPVLSRFCNDLCKFVMRQSLLACAIFKMRGNELCIRLLINHISALAEGSIGVQSPCPDRLDINKAWSYYHGHEITSLAC